MTTLRAARSLIAEPEDWLHKGAAETADGRAVGFDHPDAVRFCLVSAVYRADVDVGEEAALRRLVPGGMLGLWNDWETVDPKSGTKKRTHREILALLDQAIEKVERDRAKRTSRTA